MTVTRLSGAKTGVASDGLDAGFLPTVGVCFGKRGPYPFVVDTGSTRSIIDSTLASTFDLSNAGPVAVGGSGCVTNGSLVHVPALEIGHVAIAAQPMVRASLDDWAGESVDGVLGSDILGRFQAVRLDLTRHSLTLAGPEGPAPTAHQLFIGQTGTPPPTTLLTGPPSAAVPINILEGPGTIGAFAYTDLGSNVLPSALLVDTGSPTSVVSNPAAYMLRFAEKGLGVAPGGVGCTKPMHVLVPTQLTVGATSATLGSLRSMPINGLQRLGISGALGLDFLGVDGAVVVNYHEAYLEFASG